MPAQEHQPKSRPQNRVESAEAAEGGGNVAVQADTHKAEGPRTSAECGRTPLLLCRTQQMVAAQESQIGGSVRYSCCQGPDHLPQPWPCCPHPVTLQGLVQAPCRPPCNSSHEWEAWHVGVPQDAANHTAKPSLGPSAHTHTHTQTSAKNVTIIGHTHSRKQTLS